MKIGTSFTMEDMEYIDPFQYDTVILLSRGGQIESEDQMDADTLMLVMLLRRLRDQQLGRPFKSKVITQLFRPENAKLINNADPEHDDPVHCALTSRISTMREKSFSSPTSGLCLLPSQRGPTTMRQHLFRSTCFPTWDS